MIWIQFLAVCLAIVIGGRYLAVYGDVLAEKTGMGRSWIGLVLVAATTSLPEMFAGIGATAVFLVPEIAVGDVLGSCMFNLLILSMMDALGGKVPLSTRMSAGHALSIGFGGLMIGIAGLGLFAGGRLPAIGWVGLSTPVLIVVYMIAMRTSFVFEKRRAAAEESEAPALYESHSTASAWAKYAGVGAVVVIAALILPRLAEEIARQTGLDQSFVGTLFVAVTTSLPEVAVSIAAVRMGWIDLAVANVLGSNLFNMFVLGLDDVFFRVGPIAAHVGQEHMIAVLAVLAMYGILLTGITIQAAEKRTALAADTIGLAAVYVAAMAMYLAL